MSARHDMRTSAEDWREHCLGGSNIGKRSLYAPVGYSALPGITLACAIGAALAFVLLFWVEHQ